MWNDTQACMCRSSNIQCHSVYIEALFQIITLKTGIVSEKFFLLTWNKLLKIWNPFIILHNSKGKFYLKTLFFSILSLIMQRVCSICLFVCLFVVVSFMHSRIAFSWYLHEQSSLSNPLKIQICTDCYNNFVIKGIGNRKTSQTV